MADEASASHVLRITADIKDVEQKIEVVKSLIRQLGSEQVALGKSIKTKAEARPTGDRGKEAKDARNLAEQESKRAKEAERGASADAKRASLADIIAKSIQDSVRNATEFKIQLQDVSREAESILETFLQIDKIRSGSMHRVDRRYSNLAATDPEAFKESYKLLPPDVQEKVSEQAQAILARQEAERANRIETLLQAHQKITNELEKHGIEARKLVGDIDELKKKLEETQSIGELKIINDEEMARIKAARRELDNVKAASRVDKQHDAEWNPQERRRLEVEVQRHFERLRKIREQAGQTRRAQAMDSQKLERRLNDMSISEMRRTVDAIKLQVKRLEMEGISPLEGFRQRFMKIGSWMTSVWSLFGVVSAARQSIRVITDIQHAIIDLEKVMDSTTTNFMEMRQEMFNIGRELGHIPAEVGKAMFMFARQGMNQIEVLEMTRVALIGVNVAQLELEESTRMLTAAKLQLNMESHEMIQLLDAWNEVSNRNAVEVRDLGEAFTHTASLAKGLGLSVHELNALITILAANTGYAGSRIGRALRFAFNRAFSPEVMSTLSSMGIPLFEPGTGDLRNFSSVLMEISNAWDSYSDAQRQAIASAFGSTIHVQTMMILFENLSTMGIKVAEESMNSFGSATRENEKYMESLGRQTAVLMAGVQDLVVALGDSGLVGLMKAGLSAGQYLLGVFNAIPGPIKNVALMLTMATLAGRGFNAFFAANAKYLKDGVQTIGLFAQVSSKASGALTAIGTAVTTAIPALKVAATLVSRFISPWTAGVAVILAAAKAYDLWRTRVIRARQAQEEALETYTRLYRSAEENAAATRRAQQAIDELNNSSLSVAEKEARRLEIYEEFNRTIPGIVRNYDELERRVSSLGSQYEKEVERFARLEQSTKRVMEQTITRQIEAREEEVRRLTKSISEASEAFDRGGFLAFIEAFSLLDDPTAPWYKFLDIGSFIKTISQLYDALDEDRSYATFANLLNKLQDYLRQTEADIDNLKKQLAALRGEMEAFAGSGVDDPERLKRMFGEVAYELNQIYSSMRDTEEDAKNLNSALELVFKQAKDASQELEKYFDHTAQGFSEYIRWADAILAKEDELHDRRLRVARTYLEEALANEELERGSSAYYLALNKVIQAHEEKSKKINEQRRILNAAWDAGVIGAHDYFVELTRLDSLDVFERQRQLIREMNEELRSGTSRAIEQAFKGIMTGDEDPFEKMRESMRNLRADIFAKGLADYVERSDVFRLELARQGNVLSMLFGVDSPSEFDRLQDLQLEVLRDTGEYTKVSAGLLEEIDEKMDDLVSVMVTAKNSFEGQWFMHWASGDAGFSEEVVKALSKALSTGEVVELPRSVLDAIRAAGFTDTARQPISVREILTLSEDRTVRDSLKFSRTLGAPGTGASGRVMSPLEASGILESLIPVTESKSTEDSVQLIVDSIIEAHKYHEQNRTQLTEIAKNFAEVMKAREGQVDLDKFAYVMGLVLTESSTVLKDPATLSNPLRITDNARLDLRNPETVPGRFAGGKFLFEDDSILRNYEDSLLLYLAYMNEFNNDAVLAASAFKAPGATRKAVDTGIFSKPLELPGSDMHGLSPQDFMERYMRDVWPILGAFERLRRQRGFRFGGYTGRGDRGQVAGVVHKGEWVAPKWLVEKYPDAIAELESVRRRGFRSGGYTSTTPYFSARETGRAAMDAFNRNTRDMIRAVDSLTSPLGELTDELSKTSDAVASLSDVFGGVYAGANARQRVEQSGLPIWLSKPLGAAADAAVQSVFQNLFGGILAAIAGFGFFKQLKKEVGGFSLARLIGIGYSQGGFTGPGDLKDVAGVVHKNEYVIPAWMIRRYPHMVGELERIRKRGFQSGGPTSSLPSSVFLQPGVIPPDPDTLRVLMSIDMNTQAMAQLAEREQRPSFISRVFQMVFGGGGKQSRLRATVEGMLPEIDDELRQQALDAVFHSRFGEQVIGLSSRTPEQIATLTELLVEQGTEFMTAMVSSLPKYLDHLAELAEVAEDRDAALSTELQDVLNMFDRSVKTFEDAILDPRHRQNMLAGYMMMQGISDSELSGLFGAMAGLMRAAPDLEFRVKLEEVLGSLGIKQDPADVMQGMALVLGGFQQNIKEAGAGLGNVVSGLMSITGIGGPFASLIGPVLQTLFGPRQQPQKEAERIGNVRHFIRDSERYLGHERFFMSGRHAALLRGRMESMEATVIYDSRRVEVQNTLHFDSAPVSTQDIERLSDSLSRDIAKQVQQQLSNSYASDLSRGPRGRIRPR